PSCRSAYRFGASVHYTPEGNNYDPEGIKGFLHQRGHGSVEIAEVEPGIEDCFMDLMTRGGYAES
ncbi:MAG TPA: hypothetical protein VK994_04580, partial [Bacteroidales bacterium]|nr:hypothetical protein [Bacteroidales bacterium]